MSERKPFEFRVGGKAMELRLGHCAVVMFRQNQEVDYVAVDQPDEEGTVRIFNNEPFVRWLGGYAISYDEDGEIHRETVYMHDSASDDSQPATFRSLYGWNPPVIEKEQPTPKELEMWLDIQTRDIDKEWDGGLD